MLAHLSLQIFPLRPRSKPMGPLVGQNRTADRQPYARRRDWRLSVVASALHMLHAKYLNPVTKMPIENGDAIDVLSK